MKKIINDKRGDIFQVFFLLIIVFIAAIVGLLSLTLSDKFNEHLQGTEGFNDSISAQKVSNFEQNQSPYIFDYLVFFLFLGCNIGLVISSVRTNFSPGILFLFMLVLLIAVLVSAGLVNIYQGFTDVSTLSETASKLTLTNIIFSRYTPLFISLISAVVLVLMYSKSGSEISV